MLADEARRVRILQYYQQVGIDQAYPVRCRRPVLQVGERDVREYYRVRNLNYPYQYHNGGIWPFIGGFYVVALVKAGRMAQAERALERLAEMNHGGRQGEWEFNEWLHGLSGCPMGFPLQTWSAAMYLYAYHCFQSGQVTGLEALDLS